jgi:hypothetical protein
MEFIYKQSKSFNNLVYNFFSKKYQPLYKSKNVLILNNKNINHHYKTNLDEKKHTLIYISYKNIYYKEQNVYPSYKCYLDSNSKLKISKLFNYYKKRIPLSNDVLIIGKRYINRKTNQKIHDSTKLYCILPMPVDFEEKEPFFRPQGTNTDGTFNEDVVRRQGTFNEDVVRRQGTFNEDVVRRQGTFNLRSKQDEKIIKNKKRLFLYNLKNSLKSKNTMYINNIIKNGLFLDVEYTNDIYDDFSTFPISKDYSMLFMIGISFINKNELDFIHFTTDKLTPEYEYNILKQFLNLLSEKYKKDKTPPIIYHWSPADKTCLEKAFKKYPDLYNIYTIYSIQYVDLLDVVKKTINMSSYSLKYIAKNLLHVNYDTECQNGLDAMCSIIQQNNKMNKDQKLTDFDVTKDVIRYNKMDTVLLYKVIEFFLKSN